MLKMCEADVMSFLVYCYAPLLLLPAVAIVLVIGLWSFLTKKGD